MEVVAVNAEDNLMHSNGSSWRFDDKTVINSTLGDSGTTSAVLPDLVVMVRRLQRREDRAVIYYALVFLIVGLIAGALGVTGVAAVASQIAWVLFLIGVVLLIVHLATGRRTPTI